MSNTAGSVQSPVSLDGPNCEPRAAASQQPGDFAVGLREEMLVRRGVCVRQSSGR